MTTQPRERTDVEMVEGAHDSLPDDMHWICCLPESRTALCGVVVADVFGDDAPDPGCRTCNRIREIDLELPALPNGSCALCPHNVLGGA